ncbi:MAG: ParA family protein [Planctomycetota bacterium]
MTNKRQAEIIAVINQKGGVGKTTVTVNLATALGERGKRVLIVDLDSSTSSTSALGVPEIFEGTAEVLLGMVQLEEVILSDGDHDDVSLPKNVSIAIGRRNLEHLDSDLQTINKFADPGETLARQLARVSAGFDYILCDTSPTLSTPTRSAYQVARWAIISSMPQQLSVEGIALAMDDVAAVREARNKQIELLGVCMVNVDGRSTTAGSHQIANVAEVLPTNAGLFTLINRSTHVTESQQLGQSILTYQSDHKVSNQFRRLADEVEQRVQARREREHG